MSKLRECLVRMGIEQLSRLLGPNAVRLLELLNERNITASKLAELVISQFGTEFLILDRFARKEILQSLKLEDAVRLARLLQIDEAAEPYEAITSIDYRRGSHPFRILLAFFGIADIDEQSVELRDPVEPMCPTYPLFDHQRRAGRAVYEYLTRSNPPRVLLHMPTGAGKTRTAMHVISLMLRHLALDEEVVVWLAHTEELCEQAAEEFEKSWKCLGDRNVSLFRHFGPHRVDLDGVKGGLLVAGLQKLYRDSHSRQSEFIQLGKRSPLIVMDEAHSAVAPTYQHLLNLLTVTRGNSTALLGLSATPGRSNYDPDGSRRLAEFFSWNKVTLQVAGYENPVEYLQEQGYLAKVEYVPLHPTADARVEVSHSEEQQIREGLELPEFIIKRLETNDRRNLLILSRVMQEAERGGKILVYACSVEHANVLANLLVVKGFKAASVSSRTPPNRRRSLISDYRNTDAIQILTNYDVLTTGFDAPCTNVAVITRPTQSVALYSQMVGRAARGTLAGGNATCRVITVIDQIPGYRSIAEGFGYWEAIWDDSTRGEYHGS
jgi:superfamily II DNA or RNA helicase